MKLFLLIVNSNKLYNLSATLYYIKFAIKFGLI